MGPYHTRSSFNLLTDSLSDSLADTTLPSRFCCFFFARRSWFLLSFCLGLATPTATGVSGVSMAVTMVQTVIASVAAIPEL
jgi:hypothetical protein